MAMAEMCTHPRRVQVCKEAVAPLAQGCHIPKRPPRPGPDVHIGHPLPGCSRTSARIQPSPACLFPCSSRDIKGSWHAHVRRLLSGKSICARCHHAAEHQERFG